MASVLNWLDRVLKKHGILSAHVWAEGYTRSGRLGYLSADVFLCHRQALLWDPCNHGEPCGWLDVGGRMRVKIVFIGLFIFNMLRLH